MRYLPHTNEDIAAMLEKVGVGSLEALFDSIKVDPERFHEAPRITKVRRMDETGATRNPCLTGCGQ